MTQDKQNKQTIDPLDLFSEDEKRQFFECLALYDRDDLSEDEILDLLETYPEHIQEEASGIIFGALGVAINS